MQGSRLLVSMIYQTFSFVPCVLISCLCGTSLFSHSALGNDVLLLATTTSTENSGLLAHLHPDFEQKTGIRVKVIAKGTGASLQLARDGNTDVVLVHARAQEDRFIEEGYGTMRRDVMHNDFVLIGPKGDPARIGSLKSADDALERIATGRHTFISRGDGSGTHSKEQKLWGQTALPLEKKETSFFSGGKKKQFDSVRPKGDWYLSVGQGMGKTIMIASEKRAYTLADRGTFYAFALAKPPRTDLVILGEGDSQLHNPYGVIAVNPKKHPHVNFQAAGKYIIWLTSSKTQQKIGRYRFEGKVLFYPHLRPPN